MLVRASGNRSGCISVLGGLSLDCQAAKIWQIGTSIVTRRLNPTDLREKQGLAVNLGTFLSGMSEPLAEICPLSSVAMGRRLG